MSKQLQKLLAMTVLTLLPVSSFALPIDWHGSFGVDTTLMSDFRLIKSKTDNSTGNDGTQEVKLTAGNKSSASWQSYVLRLSPTMVINDAATFFGELSTGYANGGFLGDSPAVDAGAVAGTSAGNNGAGLFYHNQSLGQGLNIKKAYIELYSDTATYVIGRHTTEWGLGAIYNDGSDAWDRHASSRDGITMKLKIGNFHVSPFWSKVSNPGYTDATNAKEYGAGLLYDNPERDVAFGLMYGKKSNGVSNDLFKTSINTQVSLGENDITITDLYFKKVFGKIDMAVEVPLMSGELGKTSAAGTATTYSAKAFLLQTNYKWTDTWTVGLDAGQVSGHDGGTGKFGALYLNPNYQIANLIFRYNRNAVGTTSQSIYDSSITNARYFKLRSSYSSEKWVFDSALIIAKAIETAKAGANAYNHTKNKIFTNAVGNQSDSMGTEVDFNAKYHWNKEVSIGSALGYFMPGDYFSYTNSATVTNQTKSSLLLQINTAVTF